MPIDSKQLMKDFLDAQQERHTNPEQYAAWRTGIADLDKLLGGVQPGWYFVVAGKRKAGKTALLTTIRKQFGSRGIRFLNIGLEETNLQVAERQVSLQAGIDRTKFRDIALTADDWQQVREAAGVISEYHGQWDYGIDTVQKISGLLKELDVQALFVDYVQLMRQPGASSKVQEVGSISRDLKLLTLASPPIAVVAAAQLNDEGEYLWSRDLGRDADVAIKLTRVLDQYGHMVENKIHCEVADSRHSGYGQFDLMFNGARSLVGSFEIPNLAEKVEIAKGEQDVYRFIL